MRPEFAGQPAGDWPHHAGQLWHIVSDGQIALAGLLEWVTDGRGRRDCEPLSVPEVRAALEYLALAQTGDASMWPEVNTREIAGGTISAQREKTRAAK